MGNRKVRNNIKTALWINFFRHSWLTARGSGTGSECLITDTDSPVRRDWSTLRVVDLICKILISAGILSPTETSTISPGTRSRAKICWTCFRSARTTFPVSDSYSLRASIADSAFFSCQIPTIALAIRIIRITKGSTKAVIDLFWFNFVSYLVGIANLAIWIKVLLGMKRRKYCGTRKNPSYGWILWKNENSPSE